MVRAPSQVILPVPSLPKAETFDFWAAVTHGRVAVHGSLEVHVYELLQIRADDLVGIDKYDLVQVERKEDVQEKNLVAPNLSLFLFLSSEPVWPFVFLHYIE